MIPERRFRCNSVGEGLPSLYEVLDAVLRTDNKKREAGRRGEMFRNTGNEKQQMNQEQTLTGAVL